VRRVKKETPVKLPDPTKAPVVTVQSVTEEQNRSEAAAALAADGGRKSKAVHDAVAALEQVVRDIVPDGPYRASGLQLIEKAHRVFVNQIFTAVVRKS
jgi:hypothetical protein